MPSPVLDTATDNHTNRNGRPIERRLLRSRSTVATKNPDCAQPACPNQAIWSCHRSSRPLALTATRCELIVVDLTIFSSRLGVVSARSIASTTSIKTSSIRSRSLHQSSTISQPRRRRARQRRTSRARSAAEGVKRDALALHTHLEVDVGKVQLRDLLSVQIEHRPLVLERNSLGSRHLLRQPLEPTPREPFAHSRFQQFQHGCRAAGTHHRPSQEVLLKPHRRLPQPQRRVESLFGTVAAFCEIDERDGNHGGRNVGHDMTILGGHPRDRRTTTSSAARFLPPYAKVISTTVESAKPSRP